MVTTAETTKIDRQAIRDELEETRAAFHTLLAGIPDDALERPTTNPAASGLLK